MMDKVQLRNTHMEKIQHSEIVIKVHQPKQNPSKTDWKTYIDQLNVSTRIGTARKSARHSTNRSTDKRTSNILASYNSDR